MDEAYNDVAAAKQKEAQAQGLRNQESYNKDDPRVVNNLDNAARELDQEAANLRQAADDSVAEANTPAPEE